MSHPRDDAKENLASEPESVFMAENYEELQDLPEDIRKHVRELAPKYDFTANVLFILDSSDSISPADYEKEKNFAIKVTNAFNIGPEALHFSAMIFSTYPQMIFDFGLTTHTGIAKEIRKATHLQQTKDTAAALKLARSLAFTSGNGLTSGKKIALVITDGCSNNTIETAREAVELSLSGVLVLAIGVGSGVNKDELRDIADTPEDVFTVDSFDVLQRIRNDIAGACERGTRRRKPRNRPTSNGSYGNSSQNNDNNSYQ